MARFVGEEACGTWWWKELPEESKAGGLSQFCKQQVQSAMTSKPQEHCSTGGKGQWGNQKAGSCCIGPQGNAAPLPGKRQGGRIWQARTRKTWTPGCQPRKARRRDPTHQHSGRNCSLSSTARPHPTRDHHNVQGPEWNLGDGKQ